MELLVFGTLMLVVAIWMPDGVAGGIQAVRAGSGRGVGRSWPIRREPMGRGDSGRRLGRPGRGGNIDRGVMNGSYAPILIIHPPPLVLRQHPFRIEATPKIAILGNPGSK